MKSEKETLLILTSTGMEMAWRYAWSGFLTFSILHRPFPLPVAVGAFAAAAFFTRLSGRRNRRRIQAALLHLAGFIFAAFLIAYRLIELKGGIRLEDPATGLLVIALIVFSLLSIGLARRRGDTKKSFLAGFHGIGVILGFTTTVVLCGTGLILLTFPYLTQIADSAHSVLKEAAEPLGPVIVKIVRFIFGRSRFQIETGGSRTVGLGMNPVDPTPGSEGEVFLRQVIGWGLAGILGLMAICAFGYLMNQLIRWLLKRNTIDETKPPSSAWLLKLLSLFIIIPFGVWNRALFLLRGADSAASVYAGVLRWGRRSGLPAMPSETPGEYGIRLKHQFPKLEEEIEMIIEAFNREVYGKIMIEQHSLSGISSALSRMRSPRHWMSRMRQWFVQQPLQTQSVK